MNWPCGCTPYMSINQYVMSKRLPLTHNTVHVINVLCNSWMSKTSVTATPVQTACIDIIWNNIVTLHDASMVALSYAPNIYWKITVTDLLWPSTELKVFLTWWIQNSTRWQLVGHSTVLLHSNILNRLNWLNQLNRPMRHRRHGMYDSLIHISQHISSHKLNGDTYQQHYLAVRWEYTIKLLVSYYVPHIFHPDYFKTSISISKHSNGAFSRNA